MSSGAPTREPVPTATGPAPDWDKLPAIFHGVAAGWRTPLLARLCFAGMLPAVVWYKFKRRLFRDWERFSPAAVYNRIVVFDRPDIDGGGLVYAPDFLRVLLEEGLGRQEHVCEFASGPGYIGYYLLAHGFCRRITFVDVNPVAIAAAQFTAKANGIEAFTAGHVSDGLSQVPPQQWNLVIANPPQLSSADGRHAEIIAVDRDWRMHREFYTNIGRFLVRGGHVVMTEAGPAPERSVFQEMIEAGGGRFVRAVTRTSPAGAPDRYHYVISQW